MKPRISLRVNGARLGDATRPAATAESIGEPAAPATDVIAVAAPSPRFGLRVRPALSTKPNEYMPDDEVGS